MTATAHQRAYPKPTHPGSLCRWYAVGVEEAWHNWGFGVSLYHIVVRVGLRPLDRALCRAWEGTQLFQAARHDAEQYTTTPMAVHFIG